MALISVTGKLKENSIHKSFIFLQWFIYKRTFVEQSTITPVVGENLDV